MKTETAFAFALTCLLISIAPGAGVISSISARINMGFTRSMLNLAGLESALTVQFIAVICGLGAALASSETAFAIVKWGGAGYLIYLSWRQFTLEPTLNLDTNQPRITRSKLGVFASGFATNISNPKALIFILALIPQFIEPSRTIYQQYITMGGIMILIDTLVMTGYAFIACKAIRAIRSENFLRKINRVFGSCFAAMAAMVSFIKI